MSLYFALDLRPGLITQHSRSAHAPFSFLYVAVGKEQKKKNQLLHQGEKYVCTGCFVPGIYTWLCNLLLINTITFQGEAQNRTSLGVAALPAMADTVPPFSTFHRMPGF